MFGYETVRTHGNTGSCRALLLFNMLLEMIGPVVLSRFEWIGRMHTKATQRAIRDIFGKFIQHVQISTDAEITDNTFKNTCDTFDTHTAWDTFTTRFFREIVAPF